MPVLVTAATRHEATREIAEAVAEGLRNRRIDADALPIEEVPRLEGYAAAVIGSAVYAGRWLGSARELVVANVSTLLAMPVWLFSSGPVGPQEHLIPPGEPADARVMARLTRARAHRMFAGRLDRQRLDLEERSSSHIVHAPDADYRDSAAIDAFAGEIAASLLAAGRPGTLAARQRTREQAEAPFVDAPDTSIVWSGLPGPGPIGTCSSARCG